MNDRQQPDDPLQQRMPEIKGTVHPLAPHKVAHTLAEQLVPIVDEIRQLATDFGIRAYRVFLVHIAWTGPTRGIGQAVEISRREILPAPEVLDMGSTAREMHALGLTEAGGIRLRKITAALTEDDLLGRTPDLKMPDGTRAERRNIEFFYEVVQQRPAGIEAAVRRRYVPDTAADLRPALAGWTISLKKQQMDRARDGSMSRTQR